MPFAPNTTTELSAPEAASAARAGEVVLVDVREPDERAQARPVPSRHIPLGDLPTRLGELPRDRIVAFICRSGNRSATAAREAARGGLRVANVRGGLAAWSVAGLPVESGPEGKERR